MEVNRVYVDAEGVVRMSPTGWPEEPRVNLGPNPDSSDYEIADENQEQYEAALEKAKEESIPFEDQDRAKIAMHRTTPYHMVKNGEFYTIEPIQVELIKQRWTGASLSKNSRLPEWIDIKDNYSVGDERTVARIVTEEEKPAPDIVPESVCAKCGGVGFYHLGTHTRITCSCLRPASWSSITPERWAEFGQHYKGEPRQPAPVVDKTAAQQVVNYQLCPKCQGQGIVSKPPWVAADVESWTSDRACHTCDVCNGAKVILPFTQVQQPTEVDNKLLKKWSLAKWGNEEVLMRDGIMVAITWQEIVDELNKIHQQPTEWIPVRARPLYKTTRNGWEVTEDGEGEFWAAVPLDDGTWWIKHCVVEDEIGLCVVCNDDTETAGFTLEDVTHFIPLPEPPKP